MIKKAWTMAELAVAMVIVIILSYASLTSIKTTSNNQGKILMYATIKNLLYANGSISDKYGEFYPEAESKKDIKNFVNSGTAFPGTWYCNEMKEMLSTTNTPDCSNAATTFNLPNGVKVYGLAGNWQYPYTYKNPNAVACSADRQCNALPDIYYRNIMVDVNGDSRPNEVGIDRFLLRIYRGFTPLGTDVSGQVYPRCGTYDYITDPTGTTKYMTTLANSNSTTCVSGQNFIDDNEIVSYNIYRPDKTLTSGVKDKEVTASIVAGKLSLIKADCMAYGGNGLFNKYQCSKAGYFIHPECAHYDLCADCSGNLFDKSTLGYNVCPEGYRSIDSCKTKAAANNPTASTHTPNQACFVMLNRPTGGLGFFAGAVMGEFDM